MKSKSVAAILEKIAGITYISNDAEITLEANPNSIERKKFKNFKEAGINRISVGVQSFRSNNLKFLGRHHSNYDAIKAIEIAQEVFDNYSFDLMYTLPKQMLCEWEKELQLALQYIKYHISCYQLTIEKGTAFFAKHREKHFVMPDEKISAAMYKLTNDILESHDIMQYEISNYAKKGYESKHNIAYWKLHDYIGIGPGAHGRYSYDGSMYSTINFYNPSKWRSQLMQCKTQIQFKKELSAKEQCTDTLLMGLRLNDGINIVHIENKKVLDELIDAGFLKKTEEFVSTTLKGRLVLNALLERLL
jgi:oxygen-independent coproporphyrinogen-3 oxidase